MNDGAPLVYHGNNGFGGPGSGYLAPGDGDRQVGRYFGFKGSQHSGGQRSRGRGSPRSGQGTPRRSQTRSDAQPLDKGDSIAFGYDSDDSSLSSNASGSNKSCDKGDNLSRTSETSNSSSSGSQSGFINNNNYITHNNNNNSTREWRGRSRAQRARRIAPDRYLNASYPFQVKFTPDDLFNGSQWDNLSQEIWDKFLKSQQSEETFAKKMNLWRYLYVSIRTIFPRYSLYVVGSTMSGFGLDTSDMDLCLYVRPIENIEPRSHALLHLGFILSYIKAFDAGAELIQAKVPILKFGDARNGLQVDLNCNNVVGIRNTNLLHFYSRLDWRVRPLVVVTKLWASAHNINDARQRTLSSYSLTLMVIQFLQCGISPPVLPCLCVRTISWDAGARWPPQHHSHNRQSLAELFTQLLRYYAHFPYDKLAVSVRAGQPVPVAECRAARSHKNDPHQWKLLCVEEPFDLTNTARSVYDPETFEKIVDTFRASYKSLAEGLRLAHAWPAPLAASAAPGPAPLDR